MKPLKRIKNSLYHYKNGDRVHGPHAELSGDCSGMWGNCSELSGDCSGLRGDCSGLGGNLDEIPDSARPGDISDWVE